MPLKPPATIVSGGSKVLEVPETIVAGGSKVLEVSKTIVSGGSKILKSQEIIVSGGSKVLEVPEIIISWGFKVLGIPATIVSGGFKVLGIPATIVSGGFKVLGVPATIVSGGSKVLGVPATIVSGSAKKNYPRKLVFPADNFFLSLTAMQVILGTFGEIRQPQSGKYIQVGKLPCVTERFDLTQVDEKDSGPSCSLAEAIEHQDLFINSTLANTGSKLLWKLFREGMTNQAGMFLNMDTMKMNPVVL